MAENPDNITIKDSRKAAAFLNDEIKKADAVLIGAGAGLSTAAGFTYSGERFKKTFSDFEEKYGFHDMYSGGFYPFRTQEEFWAFWSRNIWVNRYTDAPKPVYARLLSLVKEKDYFVLTTNVDHCFQKAGFDKQRLFYTQGDYGLFQCSVPCHEETYENEDTIVSMLAQQEDMRVPSGLIPLCPHCGKPMTLNLRSDNHFVQDEGWYRASDRYEAFVRSHETGRVLFLELGVGYNTPGIIKYPFWRMTAKNPHAEYIRINPESSAVPDRIKSQTVCIAADIAEVLLS